MSTAKAGKSNNRHTFKIQYDKTTQAGSYSYKPVNSISQAPVRAGFWFTAEELQALFGMNALEQMQVTIEPLVG